jgi:cell division protein FtsL
LRRRHAAARIHAHVERPVARETEAARRLYSELQQQQEIAHKIDVEWGQLQLEQSAWATRSRVENIATTELHMIVPPPTRIQAVLLHAGGGTR